MNKEITTEQVKEFCEKLKCPECGGYGRVEGKPTLEDPDGYIPCPTCKGTGRRGKLAIVEEAELPEIPDFQYDKEEYRPYLRRGAINYSKLLKNNWVKVVK